MNLTIENLTFEISQSTIDAFKHRELFLSMGEKWLKRNDPRGKLDYRLMQEISDCICYDFSDAYEYLEDYEQEEIGEPLLELSFAEEIEILRKLLEAEGVIEKEE